VNHKSPHIHLQNIPIRSDLGARIRANFRGKIPRILFSADFSSLEMRLTALATKP
jgi:DNA polymerase I-like protein with 3'-5' exonuclease and polymerase domains